MELGKRPREDDDFEDVSEATQPLSNANLRGKIIKLSPMKKGRISQYFNGEISGCKGPPKKLIGFGEEQHKKLKKSFERGIMVELSNCIVQPDQRTVNEMEVKVNEETDIAESCDAFAHEAVQTNITKLDQIHMLQQYDPITVCIKVHTVGERETTSNGYVQNIQIMDESGSCRLAIWGTWIGKIVEGESYRLVNVVVRKYNGETYLTTSRQYPFEIKLIRDGEKVEDDHAAAMHVNNVTVVGIKDFITCTECGGEAHWEDEELVKCSKCQFTTIGNPKSKKAELVVKFEEGDKLTLSADCEAIASIADMDIANISKKDVLQAKSFAVSYCGNEIVSVKRE